MLLASLQNVTLHRAGKLLLDNVSLGLHAGERVCLVGRNGVGKSSLMRLLAGTLTPDRGEVILSAGVRFGYMPQDVPTHWRGSVFSVAADGIKGLGHKLSAAYAVSTGQEKLIPETERERAHAWLEDNAVWERFDEVMGALRRLGLDPSAEFTTLSGGRRRRVALARAVLSSKNLLLDEPTNHLDIRNIEALQDLLTRRAQTVLFISHDRAFARAIATSVAEIDRGHLYAYDCGYDDYLPRRDLRLDNEEKENAAFDKKLAQEEIWIRKGIKARRTRNMGRVRALIAMREERAQRRARIGGVRMETQEAEKSGDLVIEARDLGFTWEDGYEVFHGFSGIIRRGERVGVIGDNGAGKTTLLRVLLGELPPTKGSVRHGTNLEVAYFDQLRETLDPDATVMDSVANGADTIEFNGRRMHVAGYLTRMLFAPDRLRVPVSTLSGGETNRLLLARLFTKKSNLLVMDEPTNDLDAETLDLLLELLADYKGTVLLVSHDRDFLDSLVTSTLALEGDRLVREYVGGYTDWLRQRPVPEERQTADREAARAARRAEAPDRPRRLTFREQRERDALRKELEALPRAIEALETEQATLEEQLADPDFFGSAPDAFARAAARLAAIENEQTAALERWEAVEVRLGELATITRKPEG